MNEAAKPREVKSKEPGMARLILVLFIISVITSLLLGAVNYITAKPIAELKEEKAIEAKQRVLSADEYIDVPYSGDDDLIESISRAMNGGAQTGWVVRVQSSGFAGAIDMVVGLDMQGTVTGISIISMSETSGLGANAGSDSFGNQFKGLSGEIKVNKDGGTIDALTGATVTSRAVTKGVNSAIAVVKEMEG